MTQLTPPMETSIFHKKQRKHQFLYNSVEIDVYSLARDIQVPDPQKILSFYVVALLPVSLLSRILARCLLAFFFGIGTM